MLYAVLITSRKLRHYFEYYKITVVTEFPLGDIPHNKEANGHIIKWAIELGVKCVMVYEDSTLVINQLNKGWSCSSEKMDAYCAEIRKLEGKFYGIEYHHMVLTGR